MTTPIPTVALYGAVNAIINVLLAVNVSRLRGQSKVLLGTGDSEALLRASRAHGNNAEYVPLALLLLLIAELSGGASVPLHALGGTLTAARIFQAHGILSGVNPTRAIGTVLTWLIMAGAAVYVLILRYNG